MKIGNIMAFAGALLVVGCGSASSDIVGKWAVDPKSLSSNNPQTDQMAKSLAQAFTIEFKADKTFTMTMLLPITGTYEISGHTVTMHATSAMGMDLSKMNQGNANPSSNPPMQATLSDDGKTLTVGQNGKNTVFVKQPS